MNEVKKVKKRKKRISKISTIILLITILIFYSTIFYINIIPILYSILALIVTLAIVFGLLFLNFSKKKGLRIIGIFLSSVIIAVFIFVEIYLFNTLGFLFNVTDGDYTLKTYNILVLDESKYDEIDDLNKKNIGINETIVDDSLEKTIEKIDKKIDVDYEKYEDSNALVEALVKEEVEGIILENSEIDLIKEQDLETYETLKIIYELEIKNDIKDLSAAVNINREPFNIYISGIDTFGKINSSSRSDVNIVLTVNPKTEKIFITWIPRDYYVSINKSKYNDKLTHAGIYGVDSSIYAIEHLLDLEINYYVKVNFTSVIDVVDLLGGITVYNDETFTSLEGITYNKGNITLNGEKTLNFVRERKNVSGGDLGRGRHQIMVLEAIMKKAMSPSIIKTYNSLLNSLDGAFVTNMNHTTMLGFVRKEIQSPRDWQIESNTLTGTDGYDYTYTYKNSELYVMKPDKDSVKEAKSKIQKLTEN